LHTFAHFSLAHSLNCYYHHDEQKDQRVTTKPTINVTIGSVKAIDWRTRALLAEAELKTVRVALDSATEHLAGIELRFASRAALVSLTREGRINRFTFLRNGQMFRIETMGLLSDDWNQWKKDLLE
jgi:hypothetical protein